MQVTPELNREPLFGQGRSHPSVRCCALRLTDSRLIITRAQRATPRSTWQSVSKRIHLQNCGKGSPPRSVATRDGWGTGQGVHIQQRGHKGRCILGFFFFFAKSRFVDGGERNNDNRRPREDKVRLCVWRGEALCGEKVDSLRLAYN